jgi:hypothetical protein
MSSSKTNSELLHSIKQANKVARERRAKHLGFASSALLITFLEGAIRNGKGNTLYSAPVSGTSSSKSGSNKTTSSSKSSKSTAKVETKKVPTSIPTVHIVDILDASGSMSGGKFMAAIKGINMGIKQMKEDTNPIHYTYTLCDFSDDIIFRNIKSPIKIVESIKGETRGSTALFDAIGMSIDKISSGIGKGDKVLVNVYTDGQENSSRHYKGAQIAASIKMLSEVGWTFTFIGTDVDVKYAQSILHFHESNTLVHDNTAKGMEKSFVANNVARSTYSSKLSKGEDVSTDYFKDIN